MPDFLSFDWVALLFYVLAFLLIGAGYVGCVIPYPGSICMLLGLICLDWAKTDSETQCWVWFILGLLTIGGFFADNVATMLGAKKFGSSKCAIWSAVLGLFIGTFFFPWGLVIGPFLGALLAELIIHNKDADAALKSGLGAVLGCMAGILAKIFICTVMLFFYLLAA